MTSRYCRSRKMMLRQERIIVYECSWVCIIQPDRSFEVARDGLTMKTATLALLVLLLASPARADNEMTAGDLYSLYTSADENDLTSCRFYVFGVVRG